MELLLDKIGQGQRIQADLERVARHLLERLGNEESASTVRADLKSAAARLTDLDAGLCTWRDFLQRVSRLYVSLERGVEAIRLTLQSVQNDLVAENELPTSPQEAAQLLLVYRVSCCWESFCFHYYSIDGMFLYIKWFVWVIQEHLLTVQTLTADIEKQEVVAGEIRSCVNIPDAKRIWQRLAALQIRRSETEDRFNTLIQLLEERQDWPQVFEARYNRFAAWAGSMEQRLLHKQRALLDDVIQRLSGPLRDELSAKENERRWLVKQGREMSQSCESPEKRDELLAQVAQVEETWRKLMETWNQELQRLQQLPTDLDGLNSSLVELTTWFSQVEATLNAPIVVAACNEAAVKDRLAEHRDLEESIEKKRPIVASVVSLCESFTTNYALLHGWLGTDLDAVECAMHALQRRWKAICRASTETSANLETLWPDWSAVLELGDQLDQILDHIEQTSSDLKKEADGGQLELLVQQLHVPATRQKLSRLNELFCILARDGRLDASGELQQTVAGLNQRWRDLSEKLSALLQTTRDSSSLVHHWQVSTSILSSRVLIFAIHLMTESFFRA